MIYVDQKNIKKKGSAINSNIKSARNNMKFNMKKGRRGVLPDN